jgi:hypothetical protein
MPSSELAESPLRDNGIYRFRDREWVALHLATEGLPWRSTALLPHPFEAPPNAILYLRHADGALLDVTDFQPIGTLADLDDTGLDAMEEP